MSSSKLCVLFLSVLLTACSISPEKQADSEQNIDIVNTELASNVLQTDESLSLNSEGYYTETLSDAQPVSLKQAENSYKLEQYNNALEEFQSLYAKDKEDTYLLFKIGNTYSRLKRNDEAIRAYKKVIALDNKHSKAWHNLGVVYMKESADTWEKMRENIKKKDPLYKAAKYYGDGMLDLIHQKN